MIFKLNKNQSESGFRELTIDEVEMVSGGIADVAIQAILLVITLVVSALAVLFLIRNPPK